MGKSAYILTAFAFGLASSPAMAGARSDDPRANADPRSADECPDRKTPIAELRAEMKAIKPVTIRPKPKRRYILM